MAATLNKRSTETKFVSLFADSRPDVDITFKDPVLSRSTSHYIVGVDNLAVSSKAMSMLEPLPDASFMRIFKKPAQTHVTLAAGRAALETAIAAGAAKTAAEMTAVKFAEIPSTENIHNVQHLMQRLQMEAAKINLAMSSGLIVGANFQIYTVRPLVAAAGNNPAVPAESETNIVKHLKFSFGMNGGLFIEGTKAFWSCFCVEFPSTRNQFGLFGATKKYVGQHEYWTKRRVLIVDPANGGRGPTFGNMVGYKHTDGNLRYLAIGTATNADGEDDTTMGHGTAQMKAGANAIAMDRLGITLSGDLMQLDRRIAIELGTSLPIKNSPMVDHQKEHPDFVIGRWIYRPNHQYTVNKDGSELSYTVGTNSTIEYQNATDRVIYHELMPQNKVQVLRVKLFARVRDFNDISETYGIRTIGLPTDVQDWWHCRLHFVTKD